MFLQRFARSFFCATVAVCLVAPWSPAVAQTVGVNFTGITLTEGILLNNNGGYAPPDNDGAVGPNHIVQLINGAFAVYDKAGNSQQLISGRQFWINAGIDPGNGIFNLGAFNARILFDPTVNRWIAAELTADPVDNSVLLARSDTANPLGAWKGVSFLGNAIGTNKFADYTRLGVDADGVYIATNNYIRTPQEIGIDGVSAFSLPKADLLANLPTLANLTRFDAMDSGFTGWSMQPVTDFGPSKGHGVLLGTSVANDDSILYRTDILHPGSAGATTADSVFIDVAPYSLPPKAAQPDGTRTINTLDHRIGATVYQVGHTIYSVHGTKVGNNNALVWDKIDEQTNLVIQEGVLSDPNFDYFQGSIAVNVNGDVVIAFTRSGLGPDGKLSAYAVVGHTVGNLTTFGAPFLLKASSIGNYHYFNGRWGDYSTTVVDPTNPNAFWTFQEFGVNANGWATQITQIIVPEPGSMALGVAALVGFALVAWRGRRRRLPARSAA